MYEMSLVLPVLLAIMAVVIDISLYQYTRILTRHALREASRQAEPSTSFVVEDPASYPAILSEALSRNVPSLLQLSSFTDFISSFTPVNGTDGMYSVMLQVKGHYRSILLAPLGFSSFPIDIRQLALYAGEPPPNESFRSSGLQGSGGCGEFSCLSGMELWNERWGKASLDVAKIIEPIADKVGYDQESKSLTVVKSTTPSDGTL